MIEGVTIKNSTGYGLLGVNVLGHSSIIRSSFIANNQFVKDMFKAINITNKCNNEAFNSTGYINNNLNSCSINGGNVYLKFENSDPNLLEDNEWLISHIVLSFGVDGSYPYYSIRTPGTGLALVIHQHVHVTINNTVSYRNPGKIGANFYFETISGSNITIHNVISKSGVSSNGSLYFNILSSSVLQISASLDSSYFMYTELYCELVDIYIVNSDFYHSHASAVRLSIILNEKVNFSLVLSYRIGGALLLVSSSLVTTEHAVVIFANNIATNGGALFIDQSIILCFILFFIQCIIY